MSLLSLFIPALVPVISEGLGRLFSRLTGGAKPVSVAEEIELIRAGNETITAIGALEQPYGTVSQWVANLRAAIRPMGALAVLGVSLGFIGYALYSIEKDQTLAPALIPLILAMLELVGSVLGYLFGYSAWTHAREAIMGYFTTKGKK